MNIERRPNGELVVDGNVIGFDANNLTDEELYAACERYNPTGNSWIIVDLAGTCANKWGANDTVAQALGVDSKSISSYKRVYEVFPPSERLPLPVSFSAHRKAIVGKMDDRLIRVIFKTGINQGKITADAMEKHAKKAKEIAIANGYYNAPISDKEVDAFTQSLSNESHIPLGPAVRGAFSLRATLFNRLDTFLDQLGNVLEEKGHSLDEITFVGELVLNLSIPEDMLPSTEEKEKPEPIEVTQDDVDNFEMALNQSFNQSYQQPIKATISAGGVEVDLDEATAFLDRLERNTSRILPKREYDPETGELIVE